jgi:hypothetical protein
VPNHDAWADVAARTETRRIVGLMIVVEEGETKSAPPTAFMAVSRKTRRRMTSISMRHLRHKRVLRRAPRLALNTRFAREITKEAPQRMKMLYKNMSREKRVSILRDCDRFSIDQRGIGARLPYSGRKPEWGYCRAIVESFGDIGDNPVEPFDEVCTSYCRAGHDLPSVRPDVGKIEDL